MPQWPQVQLKKIGTTLGSEREGQHVETYTVHLIDPEQKTSACNFPEINWRAFQIGSQWEADASVITGLLDCGTLRAPGSQ